VPLQVIIQKRQQDCSERLLELGVEGLDVSDNSHPHPDRLQPAKAGR